MTTCQPGLPASTTAKYAMASTESAPIAAHGAGKETKRVEPWNWACAQQAAEVPVEEQDHRDQPWQSLLDDLQRESSNSPEGRDLFPCRDGFYAHSLAA